jgi:hypothetical protein
MSCLSSCIFFLSQLFYVTTQHRVNCVDVTCKKKKDNTKNLLMMESHISQPTDLTNSVLDHHDKTVVKDLFAAATTSCVFVVVERCRSKEVENLLRFHGDKSDDVILKLSDNSFLISKNFMVYDQMQIVAICQQQEEAQKFYDEVKLENNEHWKIVAKYLIKCLNHRWTC